MARFLGLVAFVLLFVYVIYKILVSVGALQWAVSVQAVLQSSLYGMLAYSLVFLVGFILFAVFLVFCLMIFRFL